MRASARFRILDAERKTILERTFQMSKTKKTIAFVVYPGISLLELVGSRSLLGSILGMGARYEAVVVAESVAPIPTDTPLPIVPPMTFADVPAPEGLVVIGGGADALPALDNPELLDYIRRAAEQAELVVATSSGALLLGAAGLLEGRQAATHPALADRLETYGARFTRRGWVTDGKFTTAAGVSGAIDSAIGLGGRLTKPETARMAQLMIEYDPHPPFGGLDWDGAGPGSLEIQKTTTQEPVREIAFVLYPDLTVFDLAGPLQVISALSRIAPRFQPVVVAEQTGPVRTDIGVDVLPNRTLSDLPHPYAFFVPGGDAATLDAMSNPAIRRYVRTAAQDSHWVVSVCTGALILASVGLLEGCQATTHWAYRQYLKNLGAHYVQERWTVNGNIVNSAGVSAGIDMALYMVAQMAGPETARQVQRLIHYDPQPPYGGIDYTKINLMARLMRGGNSLRSFFFTSKPRQMTRKGV
jgi:transcriptional regulator GlxA family with amidase domain